LNDSDVFGSERLREQTRRTRDADGPFAEGGAELLRLG